MVTSEVKHSFVLKSKQKSFKPSLFEAKNYLAKNTKKSLKSGVVMLIYLLTHTIFFFISVWGELMLMIGRLPTFGIYVQMFTTVAQNFAKFLAAYFCLLVAFALSFCVLFPNYQSFNVPVPAAVVKTLGELIWFCKSHFESHF